MILPETVLHDVQYGVRMLRRNVGFTAVAVLALAVGIGVNTAVFTAYKAMVSRPIQARDTGEMVNLALMRDSGTADFTFSYPDYEAYRDSAHSFSGLIATKLERMRLSAAGGLSVNAPPRLDRAWEDWGCYLPEQAMLSSPGVWRYRKTTSSSGSRGPARPYLRLDSCSPSFWPRLPFFITRELLAKAVCEGPGSVRENDASQRRCCYSRRNYTTRFCRNPYRRA